MKINRKYVSIVFLVITVMVIMFIWGNSMQDATESQSRSNVFSNSMIDFLKGMGIDITTDKMSYIVRKAAHMTEFAGLCFMCSMSVYFGLSIIKRWRFKMIYPLFCSLFVATIDEFIQKFSDGRSSEVKDVLIDFGGALIGVIVASAVIWFINRYNTKKSEKTTKSS